MSEDCAAPLCADQGFSFQRCIAFVRIRRRPIFGIAMHSSAPEKSTSPPTPNSNSSEHLIYTGSFAALEPRLLDTVTALQKDNPLGEVNVLIGSNILASHLKRQLAGQGKTAANIRFHTFVDLVERIVRDSKYESGRPHLTRLGPMILLERILAEDTPAIYTSLSSYRGFRDALLETFRDLQDAGIQPKEFDQIISTRNRASDRTKQLLAFADLYRRFRTRVNLFHDVDDDFRAAIQSISKLQMAPDFGRFLVYGIYDATGQQLRLLAALKNAMQLIYFIPFVDAAVSEFAEPFLKSRVDELGVQPMTLAPPPANSSLGQLTARNFGFSRKSASFETLSADGSFALVSAPGESRAAVEIVREIVRSVQDKTISGFHETAVILRQPESDIPILTEILRLHGIPYYIHGGGRFAERPIAKAVVALIKLKADGFSREAILLAMELIAASLPEDSCDFWDAQAWRSLTNDPMFLGGLQAWEFGTQAILEQSRKTVTAREYGSDWIESEEHPERSLKTARRRLQSAERLHEAWRLLRQAVVDMPDALSWSEWAEFLERRLGRILEASSDWPRFLTVLDEIANLQLLHSCEIRDEKSNGTQTNKKASEEKVPIEQMKSALLECLEVLSFPVGRFQRNGVNLISTSAARGLRFPLVIIPGLDEGRFPAKLRQDPLLPDSERMRMRYLSVKSRRIEEEKLLFDMAARSAEKRLTLMTSRLDENSDRERIPSQFFLRMAAAVRGSVVSLRDLTSDTIPGFRSVSLDDPAPGSDETAVSDGEIRLRLITAEKSLAREALEALARLEPLRLKRPLEFDHARWKNGLTEFDGRIFAPANIQWAIQKMGASSGQVSASGFEEYAKCPYYFFLKRIMDLEAWEERGNMEGMDPRERGTAVHSILESFLENFQGKDFSSIPLEKQTQILEQLASHRLEKIRPAGMPDLLWEIERDALMQVLRQWLEFEVQRADGTMRIVCLEQSFGSFPGQESFPAYHVQTGQRAFDFRGKIDRVDISSDGKHARVTDYKTGMLPDSMTRKTRPLLMAGERIQLAIYKGALGALGGFAGVESIEGEYLYLQPRDGCVLPCVSTDAELSKASKALPHILDILREGMEQGVFFVRTAGTVYPNGHCGYCDYLTICGKDRIKVAVRKEKDPVVERFLGILESPQ
jgi:ATP-dependent helicase/nuclease subunit B